MDEKALFKVGYGLYILSAKESQKNNGCIINTVMQVTDKPFTLVIGVNKQNLTCGMISSSKKFNISVLNVDAKFEQIKHFGFQSGKIVDKFADIKYSVAQNGIAYIAENTNALISCDVLETFDFDTHLLFKASIVDAQVLNDKDTLTYTYYQQNIKPKPQAQSGNKTVWRCEICGYEYEGIEIPNDFICPLCKHGVKDFVKVPAQ